ncbi:MAG: hypothetical protein K8R40_05890, partial [Anaerolineaceae bacterium]|nr:hypothetical protein [Anaerolineaceae bacterium]
MAAGKKKNTGRTLILLALVIIGGLAVGFLFLRGQLLPGNTANDSDDQQEAGMIVSENMVDIYVLQQPIARGQVVEERHLLVVAYPRER